MNIGKYQYKKSTAALSAIFLVYLCINNQLFFLKAVRAGLNFTGDLEIWVNIY